MHKGADACAKGALGDVHAERSSWIEERRRRVSEEEDARVHEEPERDAVEAVAELRRRYVQVQEAQGERKEAQPDEKWCVVRGRRWRRGAVEPRREQCAHDAGDELRADVIRAHCELGADCGGASSAQHAAHDMSQRDGGVEVRARDIPASISDGREEQTLRRWRWHRYGGVKRCEEV